MTKGTELNTFITGLNADATIDPTLSEVLVDNAKTIIEEERPWVALRRTNTDLTLSAGEDQTVDMSSITDFSRFFSENPIKLYDGDNRVDYFRQVPFDRRLEYRDVSGTFCYDQYSKTLYFNGRVQFAGTLYINYIATTAAISLSSASAVWTQFPSRFLPLLGFYAIGIHAGGTDYDSISARMAESHFMMVKTLKEAMLKWDNELQQSEMAYNDPTEHYGGHRDGAINRQ